MKFTVKLHAKVLFTTNGQQQMHAANNCPMGNFNLSRKNLCIIQQLQLRLRTTMNERIITASFPFNENAKLFTLSPFHFLVHASLCLFKPLSLPMTLVLFQLWHFYFSLPTTMNFIASNASQCAHALFLQI